jgi:hypothetical protein
MNASWIAYIKAFSFVHHLTKAMATVALKQTLQSGKTSALAMRAKIKAWYIGLVLTKSTVGALSLMLT